MIRPWRKGFPWFEVTIMVSLVLIGWVAFRLYEIAPQVDENRKQLTNLRGEYLQIAEFVHSRLIDMNDSFTNFLNSHDPVDTEQFDARCLEFQKWIEKEKQRWIQESGPVLDTNSKTAFLTSLGRTQLPQIANQLVPMLRGMQTAFRNYHNAARYLMKNEGKPLIKDRLGAKEQELQRYRSRLFTLAREARMRGEATEWFLAGTQNRYGSFDERFEHLRFALLLVLVGLSFLLMWRIYRGKLAQDRRIIQQHARQHLEQQSKLDKLGHFGRLAQELAHEIKQPLTAITARIYTLQRLLPPGADTYKDATIIREEIKRLDRILKDFLELARPSEPKLIPLAAEHTLEEIRDLMGPQLEQEAVALEFDCQENLQVVADAQQLKQVLINLVKNAAESIEGHGTITLRARKDIRQLHGEPRPSVVIEVADTGPGIPSGIQSRIFDPFFSTKKEGTGLGLAIAAGIVDKHGGNLEFDTEPGRGTVFRIVLPAARQNKMHEQSAAH